MEVIRVNVHATPEGRYKTIDVITQIKRMYSNMVTFPEKPLREIWKENLHSISDKNGGSKNGSIKKVHIQLYYWTIQYIWLYWLKNAVTAILTNS